MVDLKLLGRTINESGLSKTFIAGTLGITRYGLIRKIEGVSEFKASELSKLKEVLHLSQPEFRRIFFATDVELKSTK